MKLRQTARKKLNTYIAKTNKTNSVAFGPQATYTE
jgi:hypothetical protein